MGLKKKNAFYLRWETAHAFYALFSSDYSGFSPPKLSLLAYLFTPPPSPSKVYCHQKRENDGAHQPGHYCLIDASLEHEKGTQDVVIDFFLALTISHIGGGNNNNNNNPPNQIQERKKKNPQTSGFGSSVTVHAQYCMSGLPET